MDRNKLGIATISWARNEAEEQLLTASFQQLATLSVPVFVTDGGSPSSFLEFIRSIPHFTLLHTPAKGVYAQAKNSLEVASKKGTPFLLYTEPDKLSFFQQGLPQLLREADAREDLGILMASRSAAGFASFPPFQQMTETTINNCCAEVTGQPLDYTYGPFLLNSQLVPHLRSMQEDIGWGWRPYLFILAHRLGLRVDAREGDFFCPPDQREDDADERIYRMRQLEQNIRGIVLAAKASIG